MGKQNQSIGFKVYKLKIFWYKFFGQNQIVIDEWKVMPKEQGISKVRTPNSKGNNPNQDAYSRTL
jgi:hypothetical protein